MAAGDHVADGTFTLPVSGPGAISSVAVTVATMAAADHVSVVPTSTVTDVKGNFGYKVVGETSGFTVTVDRAQLPTAWTFDYFIRSDA